MSPRRKAGTCLYCRRPIAIARQRRLRGHVFATLENLTCSARCLALYNLREANRRDSRRRLAAQAEARLSGRLCQICDAPIDPERVRRWKAVKTCSPACAAENRLADSPKGRLPSPTPPAQGAQSSRRRRSGWSMTLRRIAAPLPAPYLGPS